MSVYALSGVLILRLLGDNLLSAALNAGILSSTIIAKEFVDYCIAACFWYSKLAFLVMADKTECIIIYTLTRGCIFWKILLPSSTQNLTFLQKTGDHQHMFVQRR